MRFHDVGSNYIDYRYQKLKGSEGEILWAYVDPIGIATIGTGINLRIHGRLVLQQLGFDVSGTRLSGAALAAEQSYTTRLLSAFNANYPATNNRTASDNTAAIAINKILIARSIDSNYGTAPSNFVRLTEFKYASSTDVRALFDIVMLQYIAPGTTTLVEGAEALVDRAFQVVLPNSKERVALVSLAFNAQSLIGPQLINAINRDDRAEAWYEIRYRSNAKDGVSPSIRPGIANRRYGEADLFGLYNLNPNEADYKAAYRMYTRHRNSNIYGNVGLLGYEGQFSTVPSGSNAIKQQLEEASSSLSSNKGGGATFAWDHIYVGEDSTVQYLLHPSDIDVLVGSTGNDLIFGESGNDSITTGGGNDVLYGGSGGDAFVIDHVVDRPGIVKIMDSDPGDRLTIDGELLSGGHGTGTANQWQAGGSDGKRFTYERSGSVLKITDSRTTTVVQIMDFQDGDFSSINFLGTAAADPVPTLQFVGDLAPIDQSPDPGIQIDYDSYGNVITNPGQPQLNRNSIGDRRRTLAGRKSGRSIARTYAVRRHAWRQLRNANDCVPRAAALHR